MTRPKRLGHGARLMTGATGFVGSHFLLRWLTRGENVVALSRESSAGDAEARVTRALSAAAESLATVPTVPRVRAVAGDLSQPGLGLTACSLRELGALQPGELWHFAASLQYEDRHRDAIFAANVDGTRRALELARSLGCEWFVHVSTAYTAGKRRGSIAEQLSPGATPYNNCYEASKAEAERLVVEFCCRYGMRFAVLRPSIVIGPHCSKSTGGSSTGLYGFAREIGRARAALRALGRPLQLRGEPDTELNLMPIDWFVDDVDSLLAGRDDASGIHHHTTDGSPTIQRVGELLAELLGLPGFDVSLAHGLPASSLERALARRTAFYGAYLSASKRFERSRPLGRALSLEDVREYLASGLGDSEVLGRGAPLAAPLQRLAR